MAIKNRQMSILYYRATLTLTISIL